MQISIEPDDAQRLMRLIERPDTPDELFDSALRVLLMPNADNRQLQNTRHKVASMIEAVGDDMRWLEKNYSKREMLLDRASRARIAEVLPTARKLLTEPRLETDHPSLIIAALRACRRLKPSGLTTEVEKLASSEDADIRREAMVTLAALSPRSVILAAHVRQQRTRAYPIEEVVVDLKIAAELLHRATFLDRDPDQAIRNELSQRLFRNCLQRGLVFLDEGRNQGLYIHEPDSDSTQYRVEERVLFGLEGVVLVNDAIRTAATQDIRQLTATVNMLSLRDKTRQGGVHADISAGGSVRLVGGVELKRSDISSKILLTAVGGRLSASYLDPLGVRRSGFVAQVIEPAKIRFSLALAREFTSDDDEA